MNFYQLTDLETDRTKNNIMAIFAHRVTGEYYNCVIEEKHDDPLINGYRLNSEFFEELQFWFRNTPEKYDTYSGYLLELRHELSLLVNGDYRVGEFGPLCIKNPQDLEKLANSVGNLDGIMGYLLAVNPFTPKELLQDLENESFSPGYRERTTANLVQERKSSAATGKTSIEGSNTYVADDDDLQDDGQ